MSNYKYDLAISFAGEQRDIAKWLAQRLDSSGYSVFYDEFESVRLWGAELPVKLGEVYEKQARFCLVLVSKQYIKKTWPNLERRFAISRTIMARSDYVLPVKIHDINLPGLPSTIGYIDFSKTSLEALYGLLLQKLGQPQPISTDQAIPLEDIQLVHQVIAVCYRRSIFTSSDSEINWKAMLISIRDCIAIVQPIITQIKTQDLQFTCQAIHKGLDSLERDAVALLDFKSNNEVLLLKPRMDHTKTEIIRSLHQLRRRTRIPFQLPLDLEFGHFFSVEQANMPPRSGK